MTSFTYSDHDSLLAHYREQLEKAEKAGDTEEIKRNLRAIEKLENDRKNEAAWNTPEKADDDDDDDDDK